MSYLQNFNYELMGSDSAPKIIFLHGVMGSGINWRRITSEFRDRYQVLIFDQRGHGRSFKPVSGYTPEDYALDLKLIMDELHWQKAIVVGHSMGARNALHFAYKFPQRIEALVLEDIGPQGNPKAMQATLDMVNLVPVPFRGGKVEAKAYFQGDFLKAMERNPKRADLAGFLFSNIEVKPDGSADWRFVKDAIFKSLVEGHSKERWDQVRDLKVPTLLIRGSDSQDLPRAEYDEVLKINPQIQGVEIPNAGHWVHFDQPELFISTLKQFLGA
jgi:esterase